MIKEEEHLLCSFILDFGKEAFDVLQPRAYSVHLFCSYRCVEYRLTRTLATLYGLTPVYRWLVEISATPYTHDDVIVSDDVTTNANRLFSVFDLLHP